MQCDVALRDKSTTYRPSKFNGPKPAGVALGMTPQELTSMGQLKFVSFVIKNTTLV
jgi:hypothetical protein